MATSTGATGKTYKLLCLENPLLDIVAHVDAAFLEKYGLKANDAVLAEPHQLGIYDDLVARGAEFTAGGAAQNTARGAQYMLPPDQTVFLGAVGVDDVAETLKASAKKAGLHVEYLQVPDQPTGRCGVAVTGFDRSMCTDLAAANHYKLEHLQQPHIWALAEAAEVLFVGGYHLTVSPPAAVALGKEAARRDALFVLGMGAPFIPQFFAEPLAEVLYYADVVIGNETETAGWAEKKGIDSKDLAKVATAIAAEPKATSTRPRTVIITQGTLPTLVAVGAEPVFSIDVHPVDPAKIKDTTGAGDAFNAGYLAGVVQGKSVRECVDMGMWLAALGICEMGPQYPFPVQKFAPRQ